MKPVLPLAIAASAVSLLSGTAAAATGHWASPVAAIPPGGNPLSITPQAFVDSGGHSLAVAGTDTRPELAIGDGTGAFAAPIALGPAQSGTTGVDAALGSDGTLAVGWSAGGVGHVSVSASGSNARVLDIPGTGVSGVSVAVGSDGTVTAAWRVKESETSYGILEASAAPGATSFGDALTLAAGSPPLDSPEVAVGLEGAVAVVFRKIESHYRAEVAMRPALAKNFDVAVPLSAPSGQADTDPHVVFDKDGTAVAVWGNPETGPMYATRSLLAPYFGSPTALGPAGDVSSAIDLVATPSGGAAAAWSGGGAVRAAVQTSGATFGAPVDVDSYDGPIVAEPRVTVDPSGGMTVVVEHPMEGEIHAVDVGGAGSTLIGFAQPETLSPVAVASSSDRTVALWRNVDGGVSAATRSASAPASNGPGSRPAGPDRTAPRVTFAGRSRRLVFHRLPTTLRFAVACDEACSLEATGSLRTTVVTGRRGARRHVGKRLAPLRPWTGKPLTAGTQTVSLRLGSTASRDLRRAIRARRGGIVYAVVSARDGAGNSSRLALRLTLRRSSRR